MNQKLYDVWRYIKKKSSKNNKMFNGSSFCEDWKKFNNFEKWAEKYYQPGLELVCFTGNKFYSPETCKFVSRSESQKINKIKEKRSQTCLEKFGVESYLEINTKRPVFTEEATRKRKETCLKKYGKNNVSQNVDIKNKIKNTNLDKYGVECVFANKNIKDKIKQTNLQNLGKEYPTQNQEIKDKIVKTNIEKFGKKHYSQTKEYKKEVKNTCLEKYGVDHYSKLSNYKNKVRKRLKENQTFKTYDGKLLCELAEEKNITNHPMRKRIEKYGLNSAMDMEKYESGLEKFFEENVLNGLKYEKQVSIGNYRADFKIDNLILECDGLYWHSELYKEKTYHADKRLSYIQNGYIPLFFYEDEILNKAEIVKSIILNKLNKSKKIFGRKCEVRPISKDVADRFITNNHLMGKGSGKTLGLFYNNDLVSCMRFKKLNDGLDISRFCHKIGYNVIGGFSKIISNIEKNISPSFIQTFIDLRYGLGDYLVNLGFLKKSEHLSFYWTQNSKRLHRLNFKSNSGYNQGFVKLWDCGQRKFSKILK